MRWDWSRRLSDGSVQNQQWWGCSSLSLKPKLSFAWLINVFTLTFGHELRLWVAVISFLQSFLSYRQSDKFWYLGGAQSTDTTLPLQKEPAEVFQARLTRRRPRGRPRIYWRDYVVAGLGKFHLLHTTNPDGWMDPSDWGNNFTFLAKRSKAKSW